MSKRWIVQHVMNRLKNGVNDYVCFPGMRTDPDTEKYYSLHVVSAAPRRSRRGNTDDSFIINIGCHARIDEVEQNRDIVVPWKMAAVAEGLFSKVDLEITNLETKVLLGCLNIHEATVEHLDPSNLVFGGEGDFAIDDRLFHTVVVSLTATWIQ